MSTERLSRGRPEPLSRRSTRRKPTIPIASAAETWIGDGKAQGFSHKTLEEREGTFKRLLWWLENEAEVEPTLDQLTPELIRRFLAYCRDPHPEGRFGSNQPNARGKAKPATVFAYFRVLRAFCRFCLDEGLTEEDPLRNVKAPRVPKDQVQPFTPEQIQALLDAAKQTVAPDRNRCILLVLLDTGLRVSELCSLRVEDVSNETGQVSVVGKGGKRRTIYLGVASRRALRQYIRKWRHSAAPEEPLFVAEGGTKAGTALGPTGIRLMMKDCADLTGPAVEGVRVSPHTLRHSFAVSFLRAGGNLFELQQLMGHADLTILRRYVKLAESDLAQAHRMASPADRMGLK